MASGIAEDPGQAYEYAKAAHRLAARVGVVREACGIAAYRAGEWAEALAELRAARRLTGRDSSLPLMADSERALGRLDRALAIVQAPETRTLDRATQIELTIVESGIRRDQGMTDAALLTLQVPELTDGRRHPWSPRLFYAYADTLLEAGRNDEARDWFARAAAADADEETDAAERFEDLDDILIEDLDDAADDAGDLDDLADEPDEGGTQDPAGVHAAEVPDPGAHADYAPQDATGAAAEPDTGTVSSSQAEADTGDTPDESTDGGPEAAASNDGVTEPEDSAADSSPTAPGTGDGPEAGAGAGGVIERNDGARRAGTPR